MEGLTLFRIGPWDSGAISQAGSGSAWYGIMTW
jgi:hypothetical protein